MVTNPGIRSALVTGASSGIGFALSRQLAFAGVPVIALARDRGRLQSLASGHPRITPFVADLADIGALDAVAERVLELAPQLDCVIHNAALQHDLRLDDANYHGAQVREEIDVNLVAPIVLTRRLLEPLQQRSCAWVVTVGSVLATAPRRSAAVYAASKAGLQSFTRAARLQSRGTGVRFIHAVMPLVDTPMTAGRGRGKITPDTAAAELLRGLARGTDDLYIGKARAVPWLARLAPGLLSAMMNRS